MNTDLHFSSAKTGGRDEWRTPAALFASYDATYGFDLDAAADETNHLCDRWFGPGGESADAFAADWCADLDADNPINVWLNPPYSLTKPFMERAHAAARAGNATVVCLVAARPDVRWFHALVWDAVNERPRKGVSVNFLKGRVKFIDPRPDEFEEVAVAINDEVGRPYSWETKLVKKKRANNSAPFPSMIVTFRAGEVL